MQPHQGMLFFGIFSLTGDTRQLHSRSVLEDPIRLDLSAVRSAHPGSIPGACASQQLLEGSVRFEDLG